MNGLLKDALYVLPDLELPALKQPHELSNDNKVAENAGDKPVVPEAFPDVDGQVPGERQSLGLS
jgi:hypothetical protein